MSYCFGCCLYYAGWGAGMKSEVVVPGVFDDWRKDLLWSSLALVLSGVLAWGLGTVGSWLWGFVK